MFFCIILWWEKDNKMNKNGNFSLWNLLYSTVYKPDRLSYDFPEFSLLTLWFNLRKWTIPFHVTLIVVSDYAKKHSSSWNFQGFNWFLAITDFFAKQVNFNMIFKKTDGTSISKKLFGMQYKNTVIPFLC